MPNLKSLNDEGSDSVEAGEIHFPEPSENEERVESPEYSSESEKGLDENIGKRGAIVKPRKTRSKRLEGNELDWRDGQATTGEDQWRVQLAWTWGEHAFVHCFNLAL